MNKVGLKHQEQLEFYLNIRSTYRRRQSQPFHIKYRIRGLETWWQRLWLE